MKWINATHLKQWADTRDCQEVLPELILRLIHATSSHISKVKFPSGDSVHLSGWDGILDNKEKIYCFEPGISLWEIGSNQNVKNKANDDYEKRRLNSLGYDKKETIFVFVTPRIWDGAEAWTIEKKAENVWKNIVVLTAIELEDWLSLCPIVSLWLAEQLRNIKLSQISTVGSFWQKWSTGKNIVLNPDILLGGRRKEQDDLYQRLEMPSTVIIQSMAQEESLAFSVACILMHPNTQELNSRCIIVRNEDVLDRLIDEYDNLIFIADVGNKNHTYATQKGHSIIYATSIAEVPKTDKIISLPLIERDAFITSLESSGISRDNAEQLSRETVRNITILRRRLGLDYTLPEWAQAQNIHDLIPSILIGRWNDKVDGDKEILSLIANEPYDSYVRKLHRWLNSNDTPLVNVDGIWRIISPYDAFTNAANYISSIDFQRFEQVLLYVANDVDPDAMAKMETSSLAFWENKQKYSGWLKEGIFQSAILISLLSENITIMSPQLGNIWIDNIINSLLQTSNLEWWFSYKHIMPQIAESSPRSFVSFINDDLTKDVCIYH